MMMTYAEAVRRPAPVDPEQLKDFNLAQTSILFRRMKNYDGQPLTVVRQFSCEPCYKMWWTRVRSLKQVSRCKRCQIKYDPIPTDLEFGCGVFDCKKCENRFTGRIQMGHKAKCYKCKNDCFPSFIINKQNDPKLNIKNPNRHSCEICQGKGSCRVFNEILAFSEVHESTGSTLASLNLNHDLDERFIDDFDDICLPGIREISDEEGSF